MRPVAVVGPTATGKSDLALTIAAKIGGEIVNIDAMQQYRGMDIGTAKTPVGERRGIPHHRLDVLDVTATATVAGYQDAATADIEDMRSRGVVPVIVGGSMMYVQSLLDEWAFPATDPAVRAKWEAVLAAQGTAGLHKALTAADPAAAATILPTDGRRMVRALEVVELTGKPFAASAPVIGAPRWDTMILGIDRETEQLDQRIAQRTSQMFDTGLVDEVVGLVDRGLRDGVTAARAIGYAQVLSMLDGELTEEQARELTFTGTRRYVRRQRSWFRRDPRITWLDGADPHLEDRALQIVGKGVSKTWIR
ncbi:tRNA dimethylallyltransferase [Rhodococcoides trifolii]|uniref:tRNA dimethylallyltransferase n=1 Tax=Rhodococcoides trifolii TaxID=908250 RepID=A0A917D2R3_9NOCA|nr:tRNA (adenosine(37)-N6)-dimethylallyltransferase MiaA [Rhodococcus trifolii]GGG08093.1 tRNA dimethylallyltransferase [Rhodococcus trifolii]